MMGTHTMKTRYLDLSGRPTLLASAGGIPAAGWLTALLLGAALLQGAESDLSVLWSVGVPDGDNREFALAPDGYGRFKQDAWFVAGVSQPENDWPYVQPGPADAWAGGRRHTFVICFGLQKPPTRPARLDVVLLDTQGTVPPRLRIAVNGHFSDHRLPRGGGDASIQGDPSRGRRTRVTVEVPPDWLQAGDNFIELTTLEGSWLLYDAVQFAATETTLQPPQARSWLVDIRAPRCLRSGEAGGLVQPVTVTVRHVGDPTQATLRTGGQSSRTFRLETGDEAVTLGLPEVEAPTPREVILEIDGRPVARRVFVQKPVRHLTLYVLPHSHTDIGYTELQTAIEEKQVNNLLRGMAIAEATADYPEGARFVWNVEVLWAADLYLQRLDAAQREKFVKAVRRGQIALNGLYFNELTGLCRPEELLRLCWWAVQLGRQTGVPVDAAMISDVPGYTWATVSAMAQAGIRYFSVAPNYFDRIGDILVQWENKPFYWVGFSGQEKVLVWIPWRGYALSHLVRRLSPELIDEYQDYLDETGFAYDIAYIRWSGHGDNAVPEAAICDFIRDWNRTYAWPRLVISSTSQAFRAFEERYGNQLPEARGDWTPYWEDGAGSSALETAMNRASSDRLAQAQALWALRRRAPWPAEAFLDAWRLVLAYSEHTWGAWCSVTEPLRQETLDQWAIKHSYAAAADFASRNLLERAKAPAPAPEAEPAMDVWNTSSWPRNELIVVPRDYTAGRSRVLDDHEHPVPSQRLRNGDLVVLVRDVPPLAARRYRFVDGPPHQEGRVEADAQAGVLRHERLTVRLDPTTGAIAELRRKDLDADLVDTSQGEGLNDYLYLIGDQLEKVQRNGPVRIRVGERGPLVASLIVESDAPGCRHLIREIRLTAGLDRVELFNLVDKARLVADNYRAAEGKESLQFAFPFAVPEGVLRLGLPLAVIRPDRDQLPSGCKNWFTVGRWADVSNDRFGVTWLTLDAPLVEVGGLTANLLNSQTNPEVWRKKVQSTQRFYSWAMNNHWGTNYRAWQEGPVLFRYVLIPHGAFDQAAAARLALASGQPLVPVRARGSAPLAVPPLTIDPPEVLLVGLKPADNGQAWILRLWNAGDQPVSAQLRWNGPEKAVFWLSDLSEEPRQRIEGALPCPPLGLKTVRVESASAR